MWGGGNGGDCGCCAPATCGDLQAGFNNQSVMNKLNGIEQGISQAGYANLQQTNGLENGLCQLGYQTQQAITQASFDNMQNVNSLSRQLADCCCETREAVQGVNYNMQAGFNALTSAMCTNTRDIIDNQNANYRALHDEIVANRMEDKNAQIAELQSQVQALNLAQSQANQNNYLVNTLRPCPVPAYISCNPWGGQPYGSCGCGTQYSGCCC